MINVPSEYSDQPRKTDQNLSKCKSTLLDLSCLCAYVFYNMFLRGYPLEAKAAPKN